MEMTNIEICIPKEMEPFLFYLDMDISEAEKEVETFYRLQGVRT